MTLNPEEYAANPAHKYPQPDFSTLWWWKDAWSAQAMDWFLLGDVTQLVIKEGILSQYNRMEPGDSTGKSLPPVEWLMDYFMRLGESGYENSQKVFKPTTVDFDAEPGISPSVLLACYYAEKVRTLAVGGYDYDTSSRIALLLRTTRLTEADWRYLHSTILALQEAAKEKENYRPNHLLTDILRGISASPSFYELTGEGLIESPSRFSVRDLLERVESNKGIFNTQLPEIVRNPSTSEATLEKLHSYLTSLRAKNVTWSELNRHHIRWIEAHPNWSKPPAIVVASTEEDSPVDGYNTEVMHPTLIDDALSAMTPPEMRLTEEQLKVSLTMNYPEDGWEDDPALWNGTRILSGYHALRHFTPEQMEEILLGAIIDPLTSREEILCGVMPAFGALLARMTEPYQSVSAQVPLEWILEVASPSQG